MIPTYQIVLAASAVVYVGIRLKTALEHRRKATALSCKPAYHAPSGPFGLVAFYEVTKAVKARTWLPWMEAQFRQHGNTFMRPMMGKDIFMTCEPENVKAILATQFADFSLGNRYEHFQPLLGDGIFTLDGNGWSHSRALLRPQFSREQVNTPSKNQRQREIRC